MNEKEHISDDDLKKEFPLLFGIEKQENFEVPEGYFDNLSAEIISKIKTQEETKVIPLNKGVIFKRMATIASLAAVLAIGIFFFIPSEKQTMELAFTDEEVALFTEGFVVEMDDDLFYEALYSEDMELIENDFEYEDFLNENDFDLDELIYEL